MFQLSVILSQYEWQIVRQTCHYCTFFRSKVSYEFHPLSIPPALRRIFAHAASIGAVEGRMRHAFDKELRLLNNYFGVCER